jgi:hypothetical protein
MTLYLNGGANIIAGSASNALAVSVLSIRECRSRSTDQKSLALQGIA